MNVINGLVEGSYVYEGKPNEAVGNCLYTIAYTLNAWQRTEHRQVNKEASRILYIRRQNRITATTAPRTDDVRHRPISRD